MNRKGAEARRKPFRSNKGLRPDSNRGESGKVEKLRGGKLVARCWLLGAACPNVLTRTGGVAGCLLAGSRFGGLRF